MTTDVLHDLLHWHNKKKVWQWNVTQSTRSSSPRLLLFLKRRTAKRKYYLYNISKKWWTFMDKMGQLELVGLWRHIAVNSIDTSQDANFTLANDEKTEKHQHSGRFQPYCHSPLFFFYHCWTQHKPGQSVDNVYRLLHLFSPEVIFEYDVDWLDRTRCESKLQLMPIKLLLICWSTPLWPNCSSLLLLLLSVAVIRKWGVLHPLLSASSHSVKAFHVFSY